MCIYICVYIYTYIYTHTYIHIYTHTYIYIYTHTYKYTYIHTYIHIHTHTYIYTHTHTHSSRHFLFSFILLYLLFVDYLDNYLCRIQSLPSNINFLFTVSFSNHTPLLPYRSSFFVNTGFPFSPLCFYLTHVNHMKTEELLACVRVFCNCYIIPTDPSYVP